MPSTFPQPKGWTPTLHRGAQHSAVAINESDITFQNMKTIRVKLPNSLSASLDAMAASRKKTKSQIVCDLLRKAFPLAAHKSRRRVTRTSLHERLRKYQDAGPTGIRNLASNPLHLSDYARW